MRPRRLGSVASPDSAPGAAGSYAVLRSYPAAVLVCTGMHHTAWMRVCTGICASWGPATWHMGPQCFCWQQQSHVCNTQLPNSVHGRCVAYQHFRGYIGAQALTRSRHPSLRQTCRSLEQLIGRHPRLASTATAPAEQLKFGAGRKSQCLPLERYVRACGRTGTGAQASPNSYPGTPCDGLSHRSPSPTDPAGKRCQVTHSAVRPLSCLDAENTGAWHNA